MLSEDQYQSIQLALIKEPAHRLRETISTDHLGELADSIAAEGLHQPIGVRGPLPDGMYEVVWGHRRLLAMRLLRREAIPARIFPQDYDPLLASISENLQREDLTPLEEAQACARFVERGQPVAAIARQFRRSQQWVTGRLTLLSLPPDLKAAVQERRLNVAVARTLGGIDHDAYRADLIAEAERTGATAATVEVWRAHYLADRERIQTNTLKIEEIIQERSQYVAHYPCDWCKRLVIYSETRTWRLCLECDDGLGKAKAGEAPSFDSD